MAYKLLNLHKKIHMSNYAKKHLKKQNNNAHGIIIGVRISDSLKGGLVGGSAPHTPGPMWACGRNGTAGNRPCLLGGTARAYWGEPPGLQGEPPGLHREPPERWATRHRRLSRSPQTSLTKLRLSRSPQTETSHKDKTV